MKKLLDITTEIRPAVIGTAGTGATVALESINIVVGILVGLATLTYIVIRISKELKERK